MFDYFVLFKKLFIDCGYFLGNILYYFNCGFVKYYFLLKFITKFLFIIDFDDNTKIVIEFIVQ